MSPEEHGIRECSVIISRPLVAARICACIFALEICFAIYALAVVIIVKRGAGQDEGDAF